MATMAVQSLQFGHSCGSFEAALVDGRDTLLKLDVVDLPVSCNEFRRVSAHDLRYVLALQDGVALSTRRINQIQTDMLRITVDLPVYCIKAVHLSKGTESSSMVYRATSLTRNTSLLEPYSRTVPRVLWWS